jgi:hypothetical protein
MTKRCVSFSIEPDRTPRHVAPVGTLAKAADEKETDRSAAKHGFT